MLYIILFCITLFLFAPSMIYICNISEFWFTPDLLYPYISICTLAAILGLSIIGYIIKKIRSKWFEIFTVGLLFLTIILYIQGNLIPDSNGVLDGNPVDWYKINPDMILSDMLWLIGLLSLIFCIAKRKYHTIFKLQKTITTFILCFELLVTLITLYSVGGFDSDKERVCSVKGEFDFSQNTNLIILMPDMLDGKILNDYLSSEQMNSLEDFTFYSNTMGLFGRTAKALPHILTGVPYFYETEYKDYLNNSFNQSPLLKRLSEDDWSMGIYTYERIPQKGTLVQEVENFTEVKLKINAKKSFLLKLYRIIGYAYSPYHLKQFFEFYADSLMYNREINNDYPVYSWENHIFYQDIDKITVNRSENVFRFYHIEGLHTSSTTAQCTYSKEEQPIDAIFQGNMLLIEKFLNKLKEQGIYDNSIVIIMGDHGRTMDERKEWNNCFWGNNPCFMIKGVNENHPFTASDKPLSYMDLQEIFSNLLDGLSAEDSTAFINNSSRERYFYRIDEKDWDSLLIEYSSIGPAYDYTQMKPTGIQYYAK